MLAPPYSQGCAEAQDAAVEIFPVIFEALQEQVEVQSNNGCLLADDFRSKPDETRVALRDPCVDARLPVDVVGSSAGSAQATTGPPEEELLHSCGSSRRSPTLSG